MSNARRTLAAFAALGLAAVVAAFAPQERGHAPDAAADASPEEATASAPDAGWHIVATGARIIGGYGDNFVYDGKNVRPLEGRAVVELDPEAGTGKVHVKVRTTEASGPIHFADGTRWEGTVEIVQRLDTGKMDKARIAQEVFLHGDTGREAPVMPKIFNYLATWGPAKIMVNGQEAVPMIGSHTMFTEQARGADGRIARSGTVYHPAKVRDKTGFTDPDETEFHFVAHTSEPDNGNFPPHSGWIHLHFSDVEVKSKPAGVQIPYGARQARAGS